MLLTLPLFLVLASDGAFDYLLSESRAGKLDLRPFFCYFNVIVSGISLVAIIVMKTMLHMSGQDEDAFDVTTTTAKGKYGNDAFSIMVSGLAPISRKRRANDRNF